MPHVPLDQRTGELPDLKRKHRGEVMDLVRRAVKEAPSLRQAAYRLGCTVQWVSQVMAKDKEDGGSVA